MPLATTECVGACVGIQVPQADLLQFRLKACAAIPLIYRQRMVVIVDTALGNALQRRQKMVDPRQRGDAGIALGFQ
ncbi:hypothetical protein D3C76_1734080 [compost metagenome]